MFARRGSVAGSIFTTGPIITSDQSGRARRARVDQLEVHPLVDHAEEAEARARDAGQLRGIRQRAARAAEMRRVDRGRESNARRMPAALRLEQAAAAGEDQVGARQQAALQLQHRRRRAAEGGELVHAVIDDARRPRTWPATSMNIGDCRTTAPAARSARGASAASSSARCVATETAGDRPRGRTGRSTVTPSRAKASQRGAATSSSIGSSRYSTSCVAAARVIRCCGRWKTKSQRRWDRQSSTGRASAP